MGTSAAEVAAVRNEIDRSRRQLFETVEAFEQRLGQRKEEIKEQVVDRVSPSRIWQRKTAGVRRRWDEVSTSISGTTARREIPMAGSGSRIRGQAQELSGRTSSAVSSAGDQAGAAPAVLRERTERNPLAAGLLAIGAGFLAASLLPPTEREREAAERLRSELEPLKRQATEAGRQVAGELQQVAEESAQQLKERATGAVEQVKQETQSSARVVKDEAQGASAQVKGKATSASRQVKQEAKQQAQAGTDAAEEPAPPRRARRAPIKARA
ncbi:MAG: hypothetical protein M3P97_11640 [Actinomycetota bacterium]|nr:hypothetical protein [Actinomycetota bacterium]